MKLKLSLAAGCALILCMAVHASAAGPSLEAPIPVLIVDGQSGGAYHAWQLTTPVLKRELELTGRFAVTVATSPKSDGDFSSFHPEWNQYRAVVWNYDASDWPEPLQRQMEDYVRGGGGLVIIHAADNAFPNWKEFNLMTGVGGWRDRTEAAGPMWFLNQGKLQADNSPGKAGSHGARLPFLVTGHAPEHPIMRGLPTAWMHAPDELYATLRGPGKNMTVLASAHSDPENKGTGRDEPILVVVQYGKGRVFHSMMGHDIAALSCIGFMTTYQRGVEWAATGNVTQPVPRVFPSPETVSYDVRIALMDPAFAQVKQPSAPDPMRPASQEQPTNAPPR